MNIKVGGALAPIHSTPPPPFPSRSRPGLRLPSFELLGIAAPHPDRYGGLDGTLANAAREAMEEPLSATPADSEFSALVKILNTGRNAPCMTSEPQIRTLTGRAIQSPLHHFVHTLTPPAEDGHLDWNSIVTVTTAMDSPNTDPGNPAPGGDDGPSVADTLTTGSTFHESANPSEGDGDEARRWFDGALDVLSQQCLNNIECRYRLTFTS